MNAATEESVIANNLEAVPMDTLRVLVIDDEAGMRSGATRVLDGFRVAIPETDGHMRLQIDQAESGEEALGKMAVQKYDILLLDHKLPGMSGLDVLEQLNQRHEDALIIMITAYASLDVAVSATKRGAFDFLAKPFTPEELRDAVRKAARHHILRWQARKLAQEKRQVRFQFLSVLVHELKAPLAAVEGYLRLLQEGAAEDPATAARAIDRSLVRLDGMRKLIVDLLDLTRIESGQKLRELAEVDVVEVARAALETAQPAARERELTLELHAAGPVTMQADRGEVEIMLNNLVSNAVKYNRDGGRVDVTIKGGAGQGVTMAVKDNGIGMSKEETAKLFGEFVRIKNSKTRNIMGSGLGLSILRKLATMYGGDVSVESQPDVGTTFTVRLPPETPHSLSTSEGHP
jgi:two-component system, sensor histidine kinase and response regulator